MPEAAPNVTSNSDEQSEDFLGSFYGYLSAASMVPNSILLILTAFFGHRLKTQPRLVISLIFVILMFTFTSVMVFVVFININAAIFLGVAGKLSHPPRLHGRRVLRVQHPSLQRIQEDAGDCFQGQGLLCRAPVVRHSPLGRTVSDSLTKLTPTSDPASSDPLASLSRRKLESEDSSYDSDHEALTGSLSQELPLTLGPQLSRSHDDVSRTYSETLAQVRFLRRRIRKDAYFSHVQH